MNRLIVYIILIMMIPAATTSSDNYRVMNFTEFKEYINRKGINEFDAVFGCEREIPLPSGNRYVYAQVVTWCGADDPKSSYRTWGSDDPFYMLYENIKIDIDRSKIRTFINKTGSFKEKDGNSGTILLSDEYGIVSGRKYFIRLAFEEYTLPPERGDSKPQKRKNYVLWVSDNPYKGGRPQIELTPLYKHWSY